MTAEQEPGVIVFFSYARRDKMLRDRLEEHLSNLKYRGLIQTWHDRDILAGSDWLEQIDISLHNAQIILLLISSTFMASDYCYGKEMQQALHLHAQEKATVIPILLRPVLYAGSPFARLSMLPTNGKPVTSWRDRDSAFVDVALNIEKIAMYYVQNRIVRQPTLPSQSQLQPSPPSSPQVVPVRGDTAVASENWGMPPATQPAQQQPGGWGQSAQQYQGDGWGQPAPAPAQQQPPAARDASVSQGRIGILRIEEGKESGRVYEMRKESISIGRNRASDIFLDDFAVSRLHASVLNRGNGNYVLRDEGSANGTKVNGQTVNKYQPYALQEGDKIQLGQTVLVFQAPLTARPDIENSPTIAVGSPPSADEMTYRTREEELLSTGSNNEYSTRSMYGNGEIPQLITPPEDVNSISRRGETIGNSDTSLSDEHAHMISEAVRRAYYTESVAAYERILSHVPENGEALRGLGKALYGLARYDEALDAFRRALLWQETPAAYAGLGDVLLKRKRYNEAVAAYEKACELDQDVTLDYPGFIHALREVGRTDEADQMYVRGRDLGYFDDVLDIRTVPATNPGDTP